jgi:predicted phosphodiesterase
MSLILLHLSDLHISDQWSLKPTEKVLAALREVYERVEAAAILISGDIAWSGHATQYEAATTFIKDLREGMQRELKVDIKIVAVPGNHDCAFPEDSTVRDLVIEKIRSLDGVVGSSQMLRECLGVQDGFFRWLAGLTELGELDGPERLSWIVKFDLPSGRRVATISLNTAWMSTMKEEQGKLFFPIAHLPESPNADLVLSILHHSHHWLQAKNARELRNALQASCDVIITGHEHDPDAYTIVARDATSIEYVEGDLFGNPNRKGDCGFNVLLIDLDNSRYQVRHYTWDGTLFSSQAPGIDWTGFVRNARRSNSMLKLSDTMTKFLRDPGAPFTHHAKEVELEDIFVTPNLRRFTTTRGPEGLHREVVESDYVINRIFEEKCIYFSGDAQCGKTALAKTLFQQALQRNFTPVLLKGARLNSPEPNRILRAMEKELSNQYGNLTVGTFEQLPRERKVIIVDEFEEIPLNRGGKTVLCQWLRERYDYVLLLGGDLTQLEELIMDKESAKMLSGYVCYQIIEFGYLLRERLIEKWFSIGGRYTLDPDELAHQVKQAGYLVDTILGKNLVPSYPIFVLSILQQIETQHPLNTKTGAFGYFFEALITGSLHRTSRSCDDIDMKYTYLAELAWVLFTRKQRELDIEELRRFNEEHWRKYRLLGSPDSVDSELADSRILSFEAGTVGFAYTFIFYYFVARHMRDNLSDKDIQGAIDDIVQNIHREDCANVIIFLTYLSKDKAIISRVLSAAREIFKETEPCDMEKHVEFLNRLQERVPKIVLPEGDANLHRKEVLREIDRVEMEAKEKEKEKGERQSETDHDERSKDLLGMNRALKSVQIMGQILRNFSGSLFGDVKLELARECFATGLRALNVVFSALEENLEGVIKIFTESLGKRLEDLSQEKKEKTAREIIFFLTQILCFGMIKRISLAVGSERLTPTYEDVRHIYDNKATEFIQTAIRLDHDRYFPEKRVMELKKSLRKNIFGETLLRILVADHFYLFPRPFDLRQRVCALLGITPQSQKKMLLSGPRRKLAK